MKRPLLWIIACAVLALGVCGSPALAEEGDGSPQRLWDEFPIDATPSPTPTAERGEPAPRRAAAPAEDDGGGMQSGTLVALLVAAAGLGALAAHTTSRRLRRRGKSAAEQPSEREQRPPSAAEPARAANGRGATRKGRAPRPEAKPGNGAAKRRASQPLVEPVRDDPARRAEEPPARPAVNSRPAADAAPPHERRFPPSTGTPTMGPGGDQWETCRIKVQTRSIKSYFYAIPYEGGPALARSPYFKAGKDADGYGPADALRELVDELTAAGWYQIGAGRAPWDLRFRRDVEAPRPITPSEA